MSDEGEEKLFSIDDVTKRWQCTRFIVDNAIKSGKLRGVRIGKRWRFRLKDLVEYEEKMASTSKKRQ